MRALVDELAAARRFGLAAPFLFRAETSAMTVARPDEHQRAERALIDDLARLLETGMEAVIEADLAPPGRVASRRRRSGASRRPAVPPAFRPARACRLPRRRARCRRAGRGWWQRRWRRHRTAIASRQSGHGAWRRSAAASASARALSRSHTTTISCAVRRGRTLGARSTRSRRLRCASRLVPGLAAIAGHDPAQGVDVGGRDIVLHRVGEAATGPRPRPAGGR